APMFERKSEYDRAIERAWKLTERLRRGDVLGHAQAEDALRVARPDHRYYALIDKLKRKMEQERGISLIAVPLVGYTLASAKEQLELGRFRLTQAARRKRKGLGHVASLPASECSFVELRAKQAMEEAMIQAERRDRGLAQTMAFLMRPR